MKMNEWKSLICTFIKSHLLISYFVLWLISSFAVFWIGKLLYWLVLGIGGVFHSTRSGCLLIGGIAALIIWIVMSKGKAKQAFDYKKFAVPFVIMMVSIGSILEVMYNTYAYFIIVRSSPLAGSILLGAAIDGALMLYVMHENADQIF